MDIFDARGQGQEELGGDCASVWLERHRLALLHAQFGDHERTRLVLEYTLQHLLQLSREGDPDVELCRRSLAQL